MEPGWTLVYTTNMEFQAQMMQQMLADHEIPSVLVNKKDSMYVVLGEIEIYVPAENAIRALHLLNHFEK